MIKGTQKGFTILEGLVAGGLVSVLSLTLGTSLKMVGDSSKRNQVAMLGVSIESALVTAINDESNYSKVDSSGRKIADYFANPQLDGLSRSQSFIIVSKDMAYPLQTSFGEILLRPGEDRFFNLKLESCAGFDDKGCDLHLKLSKPTVSNFANPARRAFTYSYEISFNERFNFLSLGEGSLQFVPPAVYFLKSSLNCPPDPVTGEAGATAAVAVAGMDLTTNLVKCIYKPLAGDTCPNRTIPVGVEMSTDGLRVKLKCLPLRNTLTCPGEFALKTLSPAALAGGPAAPTGNFNNGSCTRATKVSQYWPTDSDPELKTGTSFAGDVCPQGYRSVSDCELRTFSSSAGTCYNVRKCTGATVIRQDLPGGCFRSCSIPTCTTSNIVKQPVPATTEKVETGGNLSCQVREQTQHCGSQWTGHAEVRIRCELIDQSEHNLNRAATLSQNPAPAQYPINPEDR